jgi:sensor histidine kinase regulating citrate/malate metabolism
MVNNTEVMRKEVQLQVFQRSFSTKGQSGRAIGTYSMKLLGEWYLGGRVDFGSRTPEKTTFQLVLPKKPPSTARAATA